MKKKTLWLMIHVLLLLAILSVAFTPYIPVTGNNKSQTYEETQSEDFSTTTTATRVDATGLFSFTVEQQPVSNPGFVSSKVDTVTQFSLATKYGSQGYLAHNYLAGEVFQELEIGDIITVTYADGHSQSYQVQDIRQFQAITPDSPKSRFVDLATDEKLSAKRLFLQTYGIKDNLVFQTCIAKDTELTWGRLFIIATPVK